MVERKPDERLTEILKAASDPTRRAILTLLVQDGPGRVTDLARQFDMSLNSVSKHIKVLERAGLVSRRTEWREHLIAAEMDPLTTIDAWFRELRSIWDMRLERLDEILSPEGDMSDLILTTTRRFKASAATIFDAWLDPAMLARFMCPGPDMSVPKAETDATVGGRFDIVMKAGDQEIPHWGVYKAIDRPSKLVFTWQSPFSVEDSTVTLTLTESDGGTDVELSHVKFRDEETRDNHLGGWNGILAKLAATLGET